MIPLSAFLAGLLLGAATGFWWAWRKYSLQRATARALDAISVGAFGIPRKLGESDEELRARLKMFWGRR